MKVKQRPSTPRVLISRPGNDGRQEWAATDRAHLHPGGRHHGSNE